MFLGQEYHILGDWFIIHFTENNGMAFGLELEGEFGKLLLSLFRITAISVIGWYLYSMIKQGLDKGFIICVSLIFAGAMGNIIDSAFYGLVFGESAYLQVASIFPDGGGYGKFLHGRVVDMLYFPVIDTYVPEWFPEAPASVPWWIPDFLFYAFPWAGDPFIFFRPVFNIADSAITVGITLIIIFQTRFFASFEEKENEAIEDEGSAEEDSESPDHST